MEVHVTFPTFATGLILIGTIKLADAQDCGIWGMPCPTGPCGGFTCGDHTVCNGSDVCACIPGYERRCTDRSTLTISCSDIDECSTGQHRCPVSQSRCENSVGGYRCVPYCKAGYRNLGSGAPGERLVCRDLDECSIPVLRGTCGRRSTCVNTLGSFRCACRQGYIADGNACQDIDECRLPNRCHVNATCFNSDGSYRCVCNEGLLGNGETCFSDRRDTGNECDQENQCHQTATCTNTREGHLCQCQEGFTGDGKRRCDDVDECAITDTCHPSATCLNTVGSFRCTCSVGFTGNGVDSCTALERCGRINFCHLHAECINDATDYLNLTSRCRCLPGFTGDGVRDCTDIDECDTLGAIVCGPGEVCNNTIGSFGCTCVDTSCTEINIGTTTVSTNDRTLEYVGIGLAILASILTAVILGWLIRRKRRRQSPLYLEEEGADNPAVDADGVTIEPVPQDASSTTPGNATTASGSAASAQESPTGAVINSSQGLISPVTSENVNSQQMADVSGVSGAGGVNETFQAAAPGDASVSSEIEPDTTNTSATASTVAGATGFTASPAISTSTPSAMDSTLPAIEEIDVWPEPTML